MPKILAIDDVRAHEGATVVARTYSAGLVLLRGQGNAWPCWDELWLDHDLCAIEAERFENEWGTEVEATGLHIVDFLRRNPELAPDIVRLCTDNGTGRRTMALTLDTFMDRLPDGSGWIRRPS